MTASGIRDRLDLAPEVADALGGGAAGRRPRVDADQPRPAVPAERRGRPRVGGGGPRARAPSRRPSRSTTVGSSSAWRTADLEALATAPAGSVRKVARPSLAAALAAGGWAATTVGATMIAAHAAGISVFATGGHRRRPSRRDRRRLAVPRHLVRSRGARPDAGGGRVRRPEGDPRRRRSRSSTSRPTACRSSRSARPTCRASTPLERHPGAGVGRRTRSPPPRSSRTHLGLGLGSGILVCTPVPTGRCAARGGRPRGDRAGHRRRRGGARRRPGAHALAARPDRRAHGRRVGPGEHGADRPRRRGGGPHRRRPLLPGDRSVGDHSRAGCDDVQDICRSSHLSLSR